MPAIQFSNTKEKLQDDVLLAENDVSEHHELIVWNDEVTNPMYVRYAWADNPDGANLFNKEGLPASPFRTDK